MEDWWTSKHAGFAKAFIPAFVNSKTTTVSLLNGASHTEMQFSQGVKILADFLRQNWNVPPELLGDMSQTQGNAYDAALRVHAEGNIVPRADDDQEDWNYYLLPLFCQHPDLEPNFDTKGLFLAYDSPVQETHDFRLKRANEGLTRGAWKVDEYRVETGRKPLGPEAGGEDRLVPVNVAVTLPDGSMAVGPNQSQQGQTAPTPPEKAVEETVVIVP
jgi:hypothetical protein